MRDTRAIRTWAPRTLLRISERPSSEPHGYPLSGSELLELPFGTLEADFLLDMLVLATGLASGWY